MSIFATMSWTVLPLCLLGTAAGIVFGFLPGLSATMGVALLMPFTFNMGIMDSMALLLGVYCGGIYGGSITAILIRTPGTPAAAATVLDGYPLTQKGKAKEALSAATLGSTLGGLFSCVILILLARVVAAVALKFGAQEYFAVGIFGMSMVTALSGKNLRKGIISALLGLMLSTIGMDAISGATRFTLGNTYMMAGIETVTALVGLFAISEIFQKVQKGRDEQKSTVEAYTGKNLSLFRLIKEHPLNLLRSSIIGTIVGIIPGPMLFVDHVETVNGIYVLMILANIFMCILGMVGVKLFLKVLKVPSSALTACVLALCCIGAFAVRGYTFDIKCALVLGVLGYLFSKTDYPIPPILLGLLLGSTVESNFRRAMSQTGGDWTTFFSRPISCVLLIISIIAFCYPIAKAIIHHFKAKKGTVAAE